MNNMHGRWCNSTWRNESYQSVSVIRKFPATELKYRIPILIEHTILQSVLLNDGL